jgi:hypothetical protein
MFAKALPKKKTRLTVAGNLLEQNPVTVKNRSSFV